MLNTDQGSYSKKIVNGNETSLDFVFNHSILTTYIKNSLGPETLSTHKHTNDTRTPIDLKRNMYRYRSKHTIGQSCMYANTYTCGGHK